MISKKIAKEHRIILKYADKPGYSSDIECYLKHGGYSMLKKAFELKPEEICEEVLKSGCSWSGRSRISRWNEMEVFRQEIW